ncbi:MAG: pseudouridine synthase [Burkholderiales bacterium]
MKLNKILQSQGFGTRRACEKMIVNGQVSVSGKVVTVFAEDMEPESLVLEVDGQPWLYREYVYLALNKPADYECSRKPSHHPGVLSLLPTLFSTRNTQPVGRLDHDTTGMLLLSDDGAFMHRQASPKYHVTKTYEATTYAPVTPALIAMLLSGVKLVDEAEPLMALNCRQLDYHRLEIVLDQGKYHQVKRMIAATGHHCDALIRTAIGNLKLEALNLRQGEWCFLNEAQLGLLRRSPSAI